VHVAQDIAFVDDSDVCHHVFGPPVNFACFYEGTDDEPFVHQSNLDGQDVSGPAFATTRFLISYDYAIEPWVSVGTRLGYAVGGGPAAGQIPNEDPPDGDPNLIPAHTKARGGQPFLPLHAELRASFWFLPLDGRSLAAYAGAGFGVAQVDSKHSLVVRDCAQTMDPSWDPADGTFQDCLFSTGETNPAAFSPVPLDAWKKMGRGFVSANTGAMLRVSGDVHVVLNVNAMYMFPADGFVLEPSLGVMTNL